MIIKTESFIDWVMKFIILAQLQVLLKNKLQKNLSRYIFVHVYICTVMSTNAVILL